MDSEYRNSTNDLSSLSETHNQEVAIYNEMPLLLVVTGNNDDTTCGYLVAYQS